MAVWASLRSAETLPRSSSVLMVLWNRSTLPVVVGERGAVNLGVMPFSGQIETVRNFV